MSLGGLCVALPSHCATVVRLYLRHQRRAALLRFASSAAPRPKPARVVLTHSTYAEGLVAALQACASAAGAVGISTIVCGRLTRSRGNAELLSFSVTAPVLGGHKVLARRGSTIQEVFFTTTLDAETLQAFLDAAAVGGKRR